MPRPGQSPQDYALETAIAKARAGAAGAALAFGHRAGLRRIIGVARDTNASSRAVLTGIGMKECGEFAYQGHRMLVFESRQ